MLRVITRCSPGFLLILIAAVLIASCGVAASTEPPKFAASTIEIEPGSPADAVRTFYRALRESRIRDAILMTNLRPAIEELSDAELKEFQIDFESVAKHVPENLEINGEIVTGDSAVVTAKLPGDESGTLQFQELRLRKEAGKWILLSVDEAAEQQIKAEGKNYFYALRLETHHEEARAMLNRISKAEIAYSTLNKGKFGDIKKLIESEFLPADIESAESTGYHYSLNVTADERKYSAAAIPAEYGKTGKLSFLVELDERGMPRLTSRDNGGLPLKK